MSEELTTKSATELAELIRTRAVSSVEVVEAHLRRIERVNPGLNAIVTLADDAFDRARAAEAALIAGDPIGPLHGLPLTVKDTIDTKGLRTTSGSRLRANHIPDRDATVVARLKAAGAMIIGKTNTPEMAIPYETDNPVFGRANNPHNPQMTPGGSSGGEAAAIAACLSPAGIGSDLSGSIRVPAHMCGIVGLKPTTARVPMDGHTPASTGPLSFGAAIGPMARSVKDIALLFDVMADPTQFEVNPSKSEDGAAGAAALGRLHVCWHIDDGVAPVSDETSRAVEAATKALMNVGMEVRQATPPGVSQGPRLWVELFARAATEQMRQIYQGREDEAGPQVAALLREKDKHENSMAGKIEAAEELAKAVLEREQLREDLLRWMKTTPIILAPVGATCAFEHGARRVDVRGESVSVFRAFSYSQTYNVLGFPAVAVPAGLTHAGLPIGVQIIGPPFEERTLLAVARLVEEALGGWQPPVGLTV